MRPAARALVGFWLALLVLAGGGAVVLQLLGPPRLPARVAAPARPQAPAHPARQAAAPPAAPPVTTAAAEPASLVAAPDPALSEPAPDFPSRLLPHVGPGGLAPARAYASRAGLPAHGPQVAVMLEDIGLAEETTDAAIEQLPAAISLGVSPYAPAFDGPGPAEFLQAARRAGHETWLSLPMEPAGSPLDDEGAQSLSTSNDLEVDRRALEWSLSRCQGYVGVTNALSGLRGGRFAGSSAFGMVTAALAQRGLLYLDAGGPSSEADPGSAPGPGMRRADLTLDEQPDAPDIEARLSRLEQLARDHGSALGVAGPLRPVVIERLQAWSRHLSARGITLVPVSALPPPTASVAPVPPSTPPPTPPTAMAVTPPRAPPAAAPSFPQGPP